MNDDWRFEIHYCGHGNRDDACPKCDQEAAQAQEALQRSEDD
jgi:hypothetical protein